jgi:hypothetical protein
MDSPRVIRQQYAATIAHLPYKCTGVKFIATEPMGWSKREGGEEGEWNICTDPRVDPISHSSSTRVHAYITVPTSVIGDQRIQMAGQKEKDQ